MKKIADKVSAVMGGDGTTWKADDGRTLAEVCAAFGAGVTRYAESDGDEFDGAHYLFEDGSAIIEYSWTGWDIGYADCTCMAAGGHVENCKNKSKS